MDESIMLLNHLGDHYAEANQPKLAALYFKKAKEALSSSELVRKAALTHEQLNKDSLRDQAEVRKVGHKKINLIIGKKSNNHHQIIKNTRK